MNNKILFHSCTNERGQRLEIYSYFCENFYRVAGYHSDGRLLFDGDKIDYWEVGPVVQRFTGKSIRYEKKAKPLPTEHTVVINNGSRKRGRPVGWRKKEVKPVQQSLPIAATPIHAPKKESKPLGNAEIDKRLTLILKTVGE